MSPQQIGVISGLSLKPVTTSAGVIHAPDKAFSDLNVDDILDLAQSAARRRDGTFTLAISSEGPGGTTLTVTTAAGATTIGPFPFNRDALARALDYYAREGRTRDGV